MQVTPLDIALWTSAWASFGWFIGHRLMLGRDRANRKRDLVAFICKWQSEVASFKPSSQVALGYEYWKPYATKIADFKAEASKVRNDIFRKHKFDALVSAVGDMNSQNTKGTPQEP